MITLIIILASIYLFSTFLMWNYIRISHSKGGIYQNIIPEVDDFIFTLFPVINTVFGVCCWIECSPREAGEHERNDCLENLSMLFFNIKK